MTRLALEFRRLYLPAGAIEAPDPADAALVGPGGVVRALVMELIGPPAWEELSAVWQGVQVELGFPAPAIAVSGVDGLQLWFSLAEAVTAAEGRALLDALRCRFLPDVAARRLRLLPDITGRHARPVPALQARDGNWSAFVAPDLAPVFGDAPWLDIPPGDEGQAALLAGLGSIPRSALDAAVVLLGHDEVTPRPAVEPSGEAAADTSAPRRPCDDPREFLLQVMNDGSVPTALRIEAAKALLAHPKVGGA